MMKHLKRRVFLFLAGALLLGSAAALPLACQEARTLGDVARELRQKKSSEVQVSTADAKQLSAAVDGIFRFASQDTGYVRKTSVKWQLVGRDHVEHQLAEGFANGHQQELLTRSEVVLKKFGLLPPDFELGQYLRKNAAGQLAGYYDHEDKTMYLLNWVPLEKQRPIMAHELTHALQDQNYDLSSFIKSGRNDKRSVPPMGVTASDESERSLARRSVVEGQAMLVYLDFLANAKGLSLSESPGAVQGLVNGLESYDAPVTFHQAPRILEEAAMFPYREGLAFELQILQKGERHRAFAGVFARPPQSTYEIMEPEAYLSHARPPMVTIPDLQPILGSSYEPYDSGVIGELDVRVMAREFGRENDIYSVAQKWRGGSYVVVRRRSSENVAPPKLADLALLYVSRWKTQQATERFAQIYAQALSKRAKILLTSPAAGKCPAGAVRCTTPVSGSRILTDDGPVFVEVWPGNLLIIAQSFEEGTIPALRRAVLSADTAPQAVAEAKRELSSSLQDCNLFVALQDKVRWQIRERLREGR
jgi:hypothetical protein